MGRAPCCDKANVKRGPWSPEEDTALKSYLEKHGTGGNWIALPRKAGLKRCGKSCRLRWLNYLRPDIKHGGFTEEEDDIICTLYKSIGSRWSVIASQLPGRTDNDVKNYWNTKLKKKLLALQINQPPNKHIHHSPSPSPPPAIPNVKTEPYCYGSPMPIDKSSPCPSMASTGACFGFIPDTQRLVSEPAMFPMPGLVKIDGSIAHYAVSPPQDISAAASSALAVENNSYINSWSDNGGTGDDGFLMELGFGSSYDSFNGYGLIQDRNFEVAPNCAPHLATLANFWANADTKPQDLYQSVTYS